MIEEPSNLESHLGFWLRKLSNQVSATFASRLEVHDVTVAQWVVLRILYDHESMALKEIVRLVGVDQGALSRMVERLVRRGLVVRAESANSRRELAISLSSEGRSLVPKLAREADENDTHYFAKLPASDRTKLLEMVKTLLSAWDDGSPRIPID